MLSFQDFERSFYQDKEKQCDQKAEITEADVKDIEEIEEVAESNRTNDEIRKLCRICSSIGLISINTTMSRCNLKFKPSGDKRLWDVSISQIIADISGEQVRTTDMIFDIFIDNSFVQIRFL